MRTTPDRSQLYLSLAQSFIVVLDDMARIQFINQQGCDTLGLREDELLGREWLGFCEASARQQWAEFFGRLMRGEADPGETITYPVIAANGASRALEWKRALLRDEQGRPCGTVSSGRDVTEERETLRALARQQQNLELRIEERTAALSRSEARTRAIVETLLDSVVQIDSRGEIRHINRATEEIFGYTGKEMIGHNISMLVPEPDAAADDGYISPYLATRQARVVGTRREVMGRRKSGHVFPLELAVNEIGDERGSTFICVMRDLSQQKAIEEELRQAARLSMAAAQTKSRFLANMSHEMRTPLNAILGLSRMGMRDNPGHGAARLLERIEESGSHLLAVVNDILDFSSVEAGKLKVERRPFSLQAVIDQVRGFLAAQAEEKGLKLTMSFAPDLSDWVEGDALRLTQILTNLLANAIKFTREGDVMLRVARDGDALVFMVGDSGIGIGEEMAGRLFAPFEQADGSSTRIHGGSGLGLALSRELARMMGGDIDFDSRPGCGSSFYLTVPMVAVTRPAADSRPAAAHPASRLQGVSVLAADDVDLNRFVLEDMLAHEGAHAMFAGNGKEVLDMILEKGVNAFDVVLMDVQMPVMDGLEATRRIGALAPRLPVIGLTAHALLEERDKCLASGMVEHVTKPVSADDLVAAIRRHVPTREAAASQAHPANKGDEVAMAKACGDPNVIDLAVLAGRVGNDPSKIARYSGRFVETARDTLAAMRQAVQAGDMPGLSSLGHRLKSTALTVGAMRFGNLCHALEGLKADGDPAAAREMIEELETLLERIAQCVKKVS